MTALMLADALDGAHLVHTHKKDDGGRILYAWDGNQKVQVIEVYANGTADDICELAVPEATREAAQVVIDQDVCSVYHGQ